MIPQINFVSKLMADNIDQEALNQILSERLEQLKQSNARLSIELSIINRMIDGEELDPIDMEYYGTLHEKVAKLIQKKNNYSLEPLGKQFEDVLNENLWDLMEETESKCHCYHCADTTTRMSRMIVCDKCGNKRCPHATDHNLECTNSNEAGQKGSRY